MLCYHFNLLVNATFCKSNFSSYPYILYEQLLGFGKYFHNIPLVEFLITPNLYCRKIVICKQSLHSHVPVELLFLSVSSLFFTFFLSLDFNQLHTTVVPYSYHL